MEEWAKLIEAISGLVTGLAWPVAVVVAVWLIMRRHRDAFDRLIDRIESLQFPGGQIDLAQVEAEQQARVEKLTRAVSAGPGTADRQQAAESLAAEAEMLGRLRVLTYAESAKRAATPITPMEVMALNKYKRGLTDEEIGTHLELSPTTAARTVESALGKIGLEGFTSVLRQRREAVQRSLSDTTTEDD